MQKSLSIITVTYNAEKYLRDCVESVKKLKIMYPSMIEYVIIDGKSTDNTIEIIDEYYKSGVVDYYLSENDGGIFDAMNKGIEHSTGEYVLIIGSDDFLLPQNFEIVIDCLSTKKPDICYGDVLFTSRDGKKVVRIYKAGTYKKWKMTLGWHPPHAGTIVKKSLLEANRFNKNYRVSADIEMQWRTFTNSRHVMYKSVFLAVCRMGGTSTKSLKDILGANREVYEIAKSLGYKMPAITVFGKLAWKSTQVIAARFASQKKFLAEMQYR